MDKTLLHQALRQEQAKLEKEQRREIWGGYVASAVMLSIAGLFLAIMFQPNDDDVLIVWDYVVGITCAVVSHGSTTRRRVSAPWG